MPHLMIKSETSKLQSVVIGLPDNFLLIPPEIVNETQRRFYFGPEHPDRDKIMEEYAEFRKCLEQRQVEVLQPVAEPSVPDQLSPRDIAFVIDETIVIARMAKESRVNEWRGLAPILEQLPSHNVIRAPDDAVIEGGDVVVDHGRIYIGIGQRTTVAGARFVADAFPQYEVVVAELSKLSDGEDVIHLDCAFAPVGRESALVYPAGFKTVPERILSDYDLIEVTKSEQAMLAPNVLSISPEEVISMPQFSRMNEELRRRGIEVIEVDFSETIKSGGSFHCGTLPLRRRWP
jgi:N-dimethylarginine dimethylaminohydrolase